MKYLYLIKSNIDDCLKNPPWNTADGAEQPSNQHTRGTVLFGDTFRRKPEKIMWSNQKVQKFKFSFARGPCLPPLLFAELTDHMHADLKR